MAIDNETASQFDLLLVLSTTKAKAIATGLLSAAERKQLDVAVFLTGEGAALAAKSELGDLFANVASAVVCTESWQACEATCECGIEQGSQTNHSRMVGSAGKVISL